MYAIALLPSAVEVKGISRAAAPTAEQVRLLKAEHAVCCHATGVCAEARVWHRLEAGLSACCAAGCLLEHFDVLQLTQQERLVVSCTSRSPHHVP
jgi:hypothetical protein